MGDEASNLLQQLLACQCTLLDDVLDTTVETAPIVIRQVFRRDHNNRLCRPSQVRTELRRR